VIYRKSGVDIKTAIGEKTAAYRIQKNESACLAHPIFSVFGVGL
jgi:hypothetical protein